MNRLRFALLAAALLPSLGTSVVGAQRATGSHAVLVGGDYGDGLIVGVDPATRIVTGYFQQRSDAGQFSCIFYLRGKLGVPDTAISSYFPKTPADRINGMLRRTGPTRIVVRLAEEHGGCWNVQHFADRDQPSEFDLRAAYPWISVAVIASPKAFFFDTPGAATHRKSYVVQGDGVGVRAIRGSWLQVDFVDGRRTVSGWINASATYRAER